MKVLVTGANGYIGRHIVKKLLDNGAEVIAFDISTDGIDSRATKVNGDFSIQSTDVFNELGRPDVCLHLAWKDGFVHDSSAHMLNLSSHFKFLENMINGGLKQLAVMGTMHEIGYYEGEVNEDTPTNPYTLYGVAKNALRQALFAYSKKKNIVFQWIRAYYIFGDDLRNNSIFAKLSLAEKNNQKTFPFNSGKNKYDFISIDDLASQIAAVVLQNEVAGVINCCTGKPVSLKDMVESYINRNNYKIRLEFGAFPDRPYDSPAIWGNNEKIQKILKNREKDEN